MTREEKLAYARGYAAASRGAWPAHRPPLPPDSPLVERLMRSLTDLCDEVDSQTAVMEPGDPVFEAMMRRVDVARDAMADVTDHVRKGEVEE